MALTVEPFNDGPEDWDNALAGFDGGSFCHRFGWRSVMEDALGHQTHWVAARDADGVIRGLLPLVRVRSRHDTIARSIQWPPTNRGWIAGRCFRSG